MDNKTRKTFETKIATRYFYCIDIDGFYLSKLNKCQFYNYSKYKISFWKLSHVITIIMN